jgi:pimeloyl-ACP methyl ester carboxylesterase
MNKSLELVSLEATDKVKLPGLLYSPDKPTGKVAIWLHGLSSSIFYTPTLTNALGSKLAQQGIALLIFNNRGAHGSKSLRINDDTLPDEDSRYPGGAHFELIEDCIKDIEGVVEFLKSRDFSEFYLLGHSSGANKICAYHIRAKQNPFAKYVLAGPGDDSGLYFQALGAKRFWAAIKYSAEAVSKKDPLRIMPKYSGMHPFTAQSTWDILNPDGAYNTFPFYEATKERLGEKELFYEYKNLDRATLVIIGEQDEYMTTASGADSALKLLMNNTSNERLKKTDFQLVRGADHSFQSSISTVRSSAGSFITPWPISWSEPAIWTGNNSNGCARLG